MLDNKQINVSAIMAFEAPRVLEKHCIEAGISPEEVNRRFKALKQMIVVGTCMNKVSPSLQVDALWHRFILHTDEYMEFCSDHLGCYFHHIPTDVVDMENITTQLQKAIEMFGTEIDLDLWQTSISDCQGDSCSSPGCFVRRNADLSLRQLVF
jgi:hypothetical protein